MTISYGTLPIQKKNHSSLKHVIVAVLLVLVIGCMAWLLLVSFFEIRTRNAKKPHIILIIADDLGWNDVSFHGSPQIPTPNIDALAASGIILNNFYASPQCTPSRASLLTGRNPIYTGLQHHVLFPGQRIGLPLNLTIMPQHLKELGYSTHMIGKWHLGYFKKEYTPTYRGFDSFYGFWNGEVDHFDYTHLHAASGMWGIDFHDGLETIKDVRGRYLTDVFTEKAVKIIKSHNRLQPLFLYFAHAAPHTANPYQPLQTTPEYIQRVSYINDTKRRIYAGAVSALDESVGKVFEALHARNMLQNSIVVFISDNGGDVGGMRGNYGSNWPLRGSKTHTWEGGVRVPGILWSPLLHLKKPRISTQMMHVSDWLATLYSAAGGNVTDLGSIDGTDMWRHLVENLPSPRNEILLHVDPIFRMSALIQNDYKLVNGTTPLYNFDLWYGESGRDFEPDSMDAWVWKDGSVVKDILQRTGRWLIQEPDTWRLNAEVTCGPRPPVDEACDPTVKPCLFNITEDPCEYHDIAAKTPQVVRVMLDRIKELNSTSMEPFFSEVDTNADPRCYGFTYVPWLEQEYTTKPCGLLT